MGKIWYSRYDCGRIDWIGNFTLVIETFVQRFRNLQRRFSIMLGGINLTIGLIGLAFALWITRDRWRGKIGI